MSLNQLLHFIWYIKEIQKVFVYLQKKNKAAESKVKFIFLLKITLHFISWIIILTSTRSV